MLQKKNAECALMFLHFPRDWNSLKQGYKGVHTYTDAWFRILLIYLVLNLSITFTSGGTRWCSWLRHCATSPKVAGSIPDDIIGFLH
jgi:hypothetical protein